MKIYKPSRRRQEGWRQKADAVCQTGIAEDAAKF